MKKFWLFLVPVIALLVIIVIAFKFSNVRREIEAYRQDNQPYLRASTAPPVLMQNDSLLLEVGQKEEGDWSAYRMLMAWKSAGLSVEDASQTLQMIHDQGLPTILGRSNKEVELRRQDEFNRVDIIFEQSYPEVWKLLKENKANYQSQSLAGFLINGENEEDNQLHWLSLLEKINEMDPGWTTIEVDRKYKRNRKVALDYLLESTNKVGLKELQIPLSIWGNREKMADLAAGMISANEDLKEVTGWKGPVFGLDGRVSWRPAIMTDASTYGGCSKGDCLFIQSTWTEYAHEWFHALDLAMARETMSYPSNNPLTDHYSLWTRRLIASPPVKAWWKGEKNILREGAPWTKRRQAAWDKNILATESGSIEDYWMAKTELMAFAWEGHVNSKSGIKVLSHLDMIEEMNKQERDIIWPNETEQKAMQPYWDFLLDSGGAVMGLRN